MLDPQLLSLLTLIVISLIAFAGGYALFTWLKKPQDYPREAQVENALLPFLYAGICAAFKLANEGLDELEIEMDGVDKKAVADKVYAMLPEKIGDFDLGLVKSLVPPERFEQLVQDAYDRFDRFFENNRNQFDDLFAEWAADQASPTDDNPFGEDALAYAHRGG